MLRFFIPALAALSLLVSCTHAPVLKDTSARRIAMGNHMIQRTIFTNPFDLQAYERIENRGGNLRLYIEGRNGPFPRNYMTVQGQTPGYPVGLILAAQDPFSNVVALSLPCQHLGMNGEKGCDDAFKGQAMTSPVVLSAMNRAIDDIKALYRLNNVELVGYDEGAAVAALLATQRTDVKNLRTVAPILDYATLAAITGDTTFKDTSAMSPLDFAGKLSTIPQRHFLGEKDNSVPFDVFIGYKQAMPDHRCIGHTMVPMATHMGGFKERWAEYLRLPVVCETDTSARDIPVYTPAPSPVVEDPWTDADERDARKRSLLGKIGPKK